MGHFLKDAMMPGAIVMCLCMLVFLFANGPA